MTISDTNAVNKIASLLGESEEWSSPADYLDLIAHIVSMTGRPHPGNPAPEGYTPERAEGISMFFARDGSYGDAEGIVILDTSDWTQEHYDYMSDALNDAERYSVASALSKGLGSLDQQDCPYGWQEEDSNTETIYERECGFVGIVYRLFLDPERGEEGGYTWECPDCGSSHEWEGED